MMMHPSSSPSKIMNGHTKRPVSSRTRPLYASPKTKCCSTGWMRRMVCGFMATAVMVSLLRLLLFHRDYLDPPSHPQVMEHVMNAPLLVGKGESTITTKANEKPSSMITTDVAVERHALLSTEKRQQPNNKDESSTAQIIIIETESKKRQWAYVFFLGGIPSINDDDPMQTQSRKNDNEQQQQQKYGYRPLLHNILVSAQTLQASGTQADIVVLVHMAQPYASLSETEAQKLQQIGVKIIYTPPTLPSFVNGFHTVALEKFRVLQLVQYDRVLYMDADIQPNCNLDYIFQLSDTSDGNPPLLQENVVISIGQVPASPSIFMVKPNHRYYAQFLRIIIQSSTSSLDFNQTTGWGHTLGTPESPHDSYTCLSDIVTNKPHKRHDKWNFPGAASDAGLLWYYVRYVRQSGVSVIVNDTITNYIFDDSKRGKATKVRKVVLKDNLLRPYSCLPAKEGVQHDRPEISPVGVAPYRDIVQWQYASNNPQHVNKWQETLQQLNDKHEWGLSATDIHPPHYPSQEQSKSRIPIWSTKIQALQQWAKQQTRDLYGGPLWKPPLLPLASTHSQPSSSSDPTVTCRCAHPKTIDPCSNPELPLEDWLSNRIGLKFSKHKPACPHAARHHFHLVVPFANLNLDLLKPAYCSIQCQDYPSDKMTIYLYNDGGSIDDPAMTALCGANGIHAVDPPVLSNQLKDDTQSEDEFNALANEWAQQVRKDHETTTAQQKSPLVANTMCFVASDPSGPGGAKFWAFRLVQAHARVNDVVMVIDGDDELNTPKALQIVNQNYVDHSAWVTYGSMTGKYSDQVKGIPVSYHEGKTKFEPSKDMPSWRFGHPRSFKAHLLRYLDRKQFAFKDKTWLIKATDRGFVYRILELAGVDRVKYIPEAIYKYKWSATTSTNVKIPKEQQLAHKEHAQSLEPLDRLTLPIHVIMVCWSRVFLLQHQLVWLQAQTLAKDRQIILHLLSNNPKTHPDVVDTVQSFQQQQQEQAPSKSQAPLEIRVIQNKENWHAFSRFLYVEKLRQTIPMDFVIFVDDDQYWVPDFLEGLLSYHRPKGMTTWYGKTFKSKDSRTGLADYWTSDILWSHIAAHNRTEVKTFAYGGPGGSVYDINFWLFNQQLLRLKGDLKNYHAFDDVWSSYVLDGLLGWEQRRLPFPLPVDIANCDHEVYNETIFPSLPKQQVHRLLQLHEELAERMKAVATFSDETAKVAKTNMFNAMQQSFHWNALRIDKSPDLPRIDSLERNKTGMIGLSPFLTDSAAKTSKRAFVCISGQLERLELENKIDRFLLPMVESGFKVDVALVLSGGNSTYTNDGYSKMAKFRPKEHVPFYTKVSHAWELLSKKSKSIKVVSPKGDHDGIYQRLQNPHIHQQYLISLYEVQKETRTFEQQKQRAENHPRIYESYQRCLRYAQQAVDVATERAVKKYARVANYPPTLETYYDVYFRIREDVGFRDPLNPEVLRDLLYPQQNSIIVTGCRGWSGMNDRFASVSPDAAHAYFQRPYDIFAKGEELKDKVVNNPETFLLYSFTTAGLHVFAHHKLRGLLRIFKDTKTNQAAFYGDDRRREWCPQTDGHNNHLISLYGWNL